jgi:hypothetical protein
VSREASSASKSNEGGVMCVDRFGCCHNDKGRSVRTRAAVRDAKPNRDTRDSQAFNFLSVGGPRRRQPPFWLRVFWPAQYMKVCTPGPSLTAARDKARINVLY